MAKPLLLTYWSRNKAPSAPVFRLSRLHCWKAFLIWIWVLKLLHDHNPSISSDIPLTSFVMSLSHLSLYVLFFKSPSCSLSLLLHHDCIRPLLLIGFKCVVLLCPIHFQQHFLEITNCIFNVFLLPRNVVPLDKYGTNIQINTLTL